jgi:hypothetical protein
MVESGNRNISPPVPTFILREYNWTVQPVSLLHAMLPYTRIGKEFHMRMYTEDLPENVTAAPISTSMVTPSILPTFNELCKKKANKIAIKYLSIFTFL